MTPRSRIHRLVGPLAVLLAVLCVAAPCPAQEGERAQERRKALLAGTHVFRRILHDHNLSPLHGFKELEPDPRRCILIVLGDLSWLADAPDGLESFVRRGGAVLAASDRFLREEKAAEQLAAVAGVAVSPDNYL